MGIFESVERSIVTSLGRQVGGSLMGPIVNMLKPHAASKTGSGTAADSSGGGLGKALGGLGAIGGLAGLVQLFRSKGLGDIVNSWVGTGPNKPISTNQLSDALGEDHVNELSQQMNLSPTDALSHLKDILPQLVDKLTPHGEIPSDEELLKHLS